MSTIYLDHNASSPLDPRVLEAMRPHWLEGGNPDSRHSTGRQARRAWQEAKATIAEVLGSYEDEVIITSGGTEANNLALSTLAGLANRRRHVVSSALEHPAVREPLAQLAKQGYDIEPASVNPEGLSDAQTMCDLIRPTTSLATLILAHNETGAIQPVGKLATLAASTGVPVHTDAVQAIGRIPIDFHEVGVASLAASAHKFHGPSGIGVLLLRRGLRCTPILFGGSQQQGCRPGTSPVALAVGMATALRLWHSEMDERIKRWQFLRRQLQDGLVTALGPEHVRLNGPADETLCLPQTVNFGFPGVDGDILLIKLSLNGLCVSLGAACASGSTQPSPSLLAMGIPGDRIRSSVRFSFGAATTEGEIARTIAVVSSVVTEISSLVADQ